MFAHVPRIKDRLAQALSAGWTVVDGTEPQDRRGMPRADVRLDGASLEDVQGNAVSLNVRYVVTLVVESDGTREPFASLDAAVDAVISSLHCWSPDGGPGALGMQGMAELDFATTSQFGYRLGFSLSTTRKGVPYR